MTRRDTLISLVVFAIALLVLCLVIASKANAQQCCPPGQCPTPGGWGGVGIPGPYGGGVGVRAAPGRGLQVGVGGAYGGVVGAQVGPGLRVQAGVIPPTRPPAVPPPTHNGWSGARVDVPVQATVSGRGNATVFQITVWSEFGKRLTGTGFVYARRPGQFVYLATAAHGFETPARSITCKSYNGSDEYPGQLAYADHHYDVAFIRVPDFAHVKPSLVTVSLGEDIRLLGPTPGPGRVTDWADPGIGGQPERAFIVTTCRNRTGDNSSGSPYVDRNGGIVGMLIGGSDDGGSVGPHSTTIRNVWNDYLASKSGGNGTEQPGVPDSPGPPIWPGTEQPGVADPSGPPIFPDGPAPPPGSEPVCRDQFDEAIEALKARDEQLVDRLMVHSEAIAAIKVQIDNGSVGPPGPPGPPGQDGGGVDPAVIGDLDARLAALEALEFEVDENGERKARSLFVHETFINGKFVDSGKVWRGDTLKYTSDLIDGAPTDSFKVEVVSPGGVE